MLIGPTARDKAIALAIMSAVYIPKHFEEKNLAALQALMRAHPLGTIVTRSAQGLSANHIPFLVDSDGGPSGTLRGHVPRANPMLGDLAANPDALVIFQGPQRYITPSWYPGKQEGGKVVPTWNYAVVHAHGAVRVVEDRGWLLDHLNALTDEHESGREQPWRVDDAPAEYIQQLLGHIVGVEMPIDRLEGKWKLSQNRPARDRQGVVEGLASEGEQAAADMAALVHAARIVDADRRG